MTTKPCMITFLLFSFEEGGVEKVTINLAKGLHRKGYEVEIVCFKKEGAFIEDLPSEISIHNLQISRAIEGIPKLINYLRKNKPDILISAKHYINVVALIAQKLSFTKTKVVVTGHGMFFNRRGILSKLMRYLYPSADSIVAVSQGVAKNISEITRVPKEKITVINNPVISQDFIKKHNFSTPRNIVNNENVIVSVGRLSPEKDYQSLLKAIQKVNEQIPVRLIIVGDGPEKEKLQEYIKANNITSIVELPGFQTNPLPYIITADVFVLSSITEGLPTVLIESLYCNTPIVSTDCPSGPREILQNGRYGLLVRVGDINGLSEAIISVLSGEVSFPELRERALDFTTDKAISKYSLLLEQLQT